MSDDPGGEVTDRDDHTRSRYAGWDVLAKWPTPDWDEQTREVVRQRLADVPPLRFLTAAEARTLASAVSRIIPQSDRAAGSEVPIVPWIDVKLADDLRDGYRYEGVPPLRDAWRLGLSGLEQAAHALFRGAGFADLAPGEQDEVLRHVERGDPPGDAWRRIPATRFFRDLLCLTVVKTYYAHPVAWNEIGYSGPAAVRGHVRNWMGGVDPWDAPDAEARE